MSSSRLNETVAAPVIKNLCIVKFRCIFLTVNAAEPCSNAFGFIISDEKAIKCVRVFIAVHFKHFVCSMFRKLNVRTQLFYATTLKFAC